MFGGTAMGAVDEKEIYCITNNSFKLQLAQTLPNQTRRGGWSFYATVWAEMGGGVGWNFA